MSIIMTIDPAQRAQIQADLRSQGFFPGLFLLHIAEDHQRTGIRYEFAPFATPEQAFADVALHYGINGQDAGCRDLLSRDDAGRQHGRVRRWLVDVTPAGEIQERSLLSSEYVEGETRRVDVLDVLVQKALNALPAPRMR